MKRRRIPACPESIALSSARQTGPEPMNIISEIAYEKTDSDTIHFISLPLRESPKQSGFTMAHLA
mgnify:CR=1 FL=1